MMKITNPVAEQEARRLARDYEQHVLGVLAKALVPEKARRQFLRDAHMSLTEACGSVRFAGSEYEHVGLTNESGDLPNDITCRALGEFSTIGTAVLGSQFTLAAIVEAQSKRRDALVTRAGKLAGGRLRRFKSRRRRRAEWADHLADALDSLDSLPATGTVFEDTFRALLHSAKVVRTSGGYALADPGEAEALGSFAAGDVDQECLPEQLKRRAADNAAALRERWETILVWTYEATNDESGNADEDFELGPRKRFRAACAAARAKARQETAERDAKHGRAEEQEREERRRRQTERRAREQAEADERRVRRITQMRSNPPYVELDENKEADKNTGLESER
ncbi:hypothetical protein [Cryobacterium sp. TMT3-29-2]|uniref:hypothetical protein n=1 Tax=Cryobacterium sp. TMT3-29-2 TaxID=2555867 RepID=UPI001073EE9C|nr:hypothetical protein [Cryobacterium sp. TMT3-29-2]TFC83523.1 hypothetical protein E3O67_14450 [Cryobacterium sp. TMT3-29-2]